MVIAIANTNARETQLSPRPWHRAHRSSDAHDDYRAEQLVAGSSPAHLRTPALRPSIGSNSPSSKSSSSGTLVGSGMRAGLPPLAFAATARELLRLSWGMFCKHISRLHAVELPSCMPCLFSSSMLRPYTTLHAAAYWGPQNLNNSCTHANDCTHHSKRGQQVEAALGPHARS